MAPAVNLTPSARSDELATLLRDFVDGTVIPEEPVYEAQCRELPPHALPPVMAEWRRRARTLGLWNLFLPGDRHGAGLSNLDYAPLAEISGHSLVAPEAINCAAPDSGNMELLAQFGTPHQQERWLLPLLEAEIRSCFAMTEPEVASSDATTLRTEIRRQGDEYVLNGHKWWITGALDPRCRVALVLGRQAGAAADPHRRHSIVLVPMDTPGVEVVRSLPVFGFEDQQGHAEMRFTEVRVPADHLLGVEGSGFAMAQARLGPGRMHHCMRAVGLSERVLAMMCRRAGERVAFGQPLAEQGVVREWIANSRLEIDQARLLTLRAAWLLDTGGAGAARMEISAIKVAAPAAACAVLDRAIQLFGAAGVSSDVPLSRMYAAVRTLRIADGPDEVHRRAIARHELARHAAIG